MNPAQLATSHFAAPAAVFATATLVFLVGVLARRPSRWVAALAALGLGAAIALEVNAYAQPTAAFGGALIFDGYSKTAGLTVMGATLAVVVATAGWAAREHGAGDFYTLLLFSAFGGLLLASAGDLVTLFLGIEATSLPLYALVAFRQSDRRATEGAMKYFLLGAFSAAVMVFGMSLLFGGAGTTRMAELAQGLVTSPTASTTLVVAALALIGVGLAFKLGAAPFHFWVMDAYEASTPAVAGTLATLPKVAALAALIRLLAALHVYAYIWAPGIAALAVVSMLVGNLGGLRQRSVARLLGYSSVAQTGYVLIGLAVGTAASVSAGMTYFVVYAAAALGAFLVLSALRPDDAGTLDDLSGLGRRRPAMGVALAIFLLSLVGIPPLAGFFGKFVLFKAAIDGGMAWLAVTGLLFSVVSLGYYGAMLREAFLADGEAPERREAGSAGLAVAALAIAVLIVALAPGTIFVVLR